MAFKRLTEKQFKDISYYRYGLGPRPKDVPHITKSSYGYILIRWQRFDAWNKWQDRGKPQPRPANVWVRVPQWEKHFNPWDLRKAILKARNSRPPNPNVPVPPIPPLPANAAQYQHVAFMAEHPTQAQLWHKSKIAFSADPTYDSFVSRRAADDLRAKGHDVYVWFVPTEVSLNRAQDVARRLGTIVIIGQAENLNEFWTSWNVGCRAVIGNIGDTVRDEEAKKLVASGQMVYINEFYWNTNTGLTPNNEHMPVVSLCVAVYNAGPGGENKPHGWDPTMQDYVNAGYIWPGMSVYGSGASDQDWIVLNNYNI